MGLQTQSTAAKAPQSPFKTLAMLVAIVVVIGVFLWICHLLGITEYWAAFLFLLYWSMIDHAEIKKLPRCIVGSLVGLLASYLMQVLPQLVGPSGGLLFLGATLVLIYGQLRGWVPIAINATTMLFLTVGTATALQAHSDFGNVLAALLLGIAFFGGLIAVGKLLKERAAKR